MHTSIRKSLYGLYIQIHCFLLLVKNLFLRKKLSVNSIFHVNKLIIDENKVDVFWSVSGCHRIVINKSRAIPGNYSWASMLPNATGGTSNITFYGTGRQKLGIEILFETKKITLLIEEVIKIDSKPLDIHPDIRYKLNVLSKLKTNSVQLNTRSPKVKLPLNIELKPFNKYDYLNE